MLHISSVSMCFRFEHILSFTQAFRNFQERSAEITHLNPKFAESWSPWDPGECGFGRWFLCYLDVYWMFIDVYCQSLHNAPRNVFFSVVSALPVTSIVWNTDLSKHVSTKTCQQKLSPKLGFQKRSWNLTLPWVQVASTGLDNISSGRWSGANLQISQSWFINSKSIQNSEITVKSQWNWVQLKKNGNSLAAFTKPAVLAEVQRVKSPPVDPRLAMECGLGISGWVFFSGVPKIGAKASWHME